VTKVVCKLAVKSPRETAVRLAASCQGHYETGQWSVVNTH